MPTLEPIRQKSGIPYRRGRPAAALSRRLVRLTEMSTADEMTKPWSDPRLDPVGRAELLLARMTVDEKMAQISCYFPTDINDTEKFAGAFPHGIGEVSCLETRSAGTLDEVTAFQRRIQAAAMAASRLGIPAIFHMEGMCGAYLPGATSFPSGLARGASWDVELERAIAEVVGRQERAVGVTHTLAPVLDVSRDPRMGRHGESYSEDPTLAAALGVAATRGLQAADADGRRTEAVAKHFIGSHHTAGGIHGAHCDIPDRLLQEVYGKPFQAAITEAGLLGMMPSYNSVAGEPVTASGAAAHDAAAGADGLRRSRRVRLRRHRQPSQRSPRCRVAARRRAWQPCVPESTSNFTCRRGSARSCVTGSRRAEQIWLCWIEPSPPCSRRSSAWVSSSIPSLLRVPSETPDSPTSKTLAFRCSQRVNQWFCCGTMESSLSPEVREGSL